MSLLRADKIANRFNNTGPIIVGPSTVAGDFTVTGILTALGIGVTNDVFVGGAVTTKAITVTNSAQIFNTTLTGVTTAGIVTGATYYGDGVNITGVVTSVFPGPGIQINPVSGQGRVQISANGVAVAGYSTNAGVATDVKGGSAGAVLYQVANNDTGFTAVGNNGEILQSTGTGSPIWTSLAAINVSYADSAGISTNLFGGSAGRIPYQTGIDQTAFFGPVTSGFVIIGQGSGAPIYVDPKASLNVAYATRSGITTSVENGHISNVSSLEVTGVTTLGITSTQSLWVTGIATVGTAATMYGTFAVSSLTDNRIPIVGTGGTIEDNANLTFDDTTLTVGVDLDVDGRTELDTTNISETLNVVGITTLASNGGITTTGGDLYVGNDLNVLGIVTAAGGHFTSNVTPSSGEGVEIFVPTSGVGQVQAFDRTNTDWDTLRIKGSQIEFFTEGSERMVLSDTGKLTVGTLGVSGVTTTQLLQVIGVSTLTGYVGVGSGLVVTGTGITVTTLNVSGVSTIQTLGVLGVTTTNQLIVSGITSIGGTLYSAGITTLAADGGITTTGGHLYVGGNLNVDGDLVFDEFTARNADITGIATIATLGVSGVTTTQSLEVIGVTTTKILNVGMAATIPNLTLSTGPGVGVTAILDEDDMVSDRVDALATQQSIKKYVDDQVTAQDLDGTADTGTFAVDLDSQTLDLRGDTNQVYITASGQTVNVGLDTNVIVPNNLVVSGFTSLSGLTTITGNLGVTGLTSTQFLDVSGIASVGSAITMYGATGIISATAFYGDGSNLTGVVGLVSVTNQLYVTPDGNDENDGYLVSTAKRTVGSALTVATPNTVINIAAGNYSENNPLILPEQITLLGDSLREVSLIPQNKDKDFIYVSQGSYVENMSFTGTLDVGKAIIAFNPNKPSYVTQGPYIRNCTNFISNSIGLKVDGNAVLGATRAMNVDSYTQLNQGGIGVSITNEGYAQLVSLFTIYNDQSVVCINGGQCDLTNSNSSFGRLGLVADGMGPINFIGTVTEFQSANTNIFPIDLSVPTFSVENAEYDQVSGLATITTYEANSFTKGMSVNLSGLGFTCPPNTSTFVLGQSIANMQTTTAGRFTADTDTTYNPSTGELVLDIGTGHGMSAQSEFTATTGTTYNPVTGVLTVVTTSSHGLITGNYVKIADDSLTFSCAKDGNATNHTYPRSTDPISNVWKQCTVVNATTFELQVGKSADLSAHTFVSATANGVKKANSTISIVDGSLIFTCASDGNTTQYAYPRFTDPVAGAILGVEAVSVDEITVNVGKSSDTAAHTFVSGVTDGVIERERGTAFSAVSGTTYDDASGVLVVDAGTSTGAFTAATELTATTGTLYVPNTGTLRVVTTTTHGMNTGDLVKIAKGAITFSCAQDGNASNHAYPRVTDPVFNKWQQVTVINTTTFDINVGVTTAGDYTHTFVSGTVGGVLKANSIVNIVDDGLTFTCSKDNNTTNHSYPRNTDPASNQMIGVEAVSGDTFTVNIGQANLASFPDAYGKIFQVNSVLAGAGTSFTTYVGVSTLTQEYDGGGGTSIFVTRPYDGQIVYFDELYNTISGVTITNGGSGYTSPPAVEFSLPSESWGVRATGVARLTGDTVTSVDMISNGRGYTGNPTLTIAGSATGTPNSLPTYYVVSSATPIVGGISTVTFTENVPYAVGVGTTVPFFKQSRVLASSQAFEYIGSGNTALTALPQRGGIAIPENEIVNKNGGLVIFTSTDQAGNFKIGEGVVINQMEGSITGEAYNRSLFANITPYILALGGGD